MIWSRASVIFGFEFGASDEFWKINESGGFRCEAEDLGSGHGAGLVGWGVGVEADGKFR
jgi:hypothetical protein